MFEILRNRMTNGRPFLRHRAMEEIEKIALDISAEQADELRALARVNGVEEFPPDAMTRLEAVENAVFTERSIYNG